MRKLTNLLAITLLGSCATAFAQSNDEPTADEKSAETYAGGYDKFRFGGYPDVPSTEIPPSIPSLGRRKP